MDSKKCFKCGKVKLLDQFYAHPKMKDGHLNKCIECTREDVQAHRIRNPEKFRAYEAERTKKPGRITTARNHTIDWRAKHPEKYRAQVAVNNAVRDGRLLKPDHCEVCDKKCKPHAHHRDYSKPLEVIWACPKCHRDLHHQEAASRV